MPNLDSPLGPSGAAILSAMREADIEFVAALPDITTSAGLLWPLSKREDFRLIRLCKEDEGVSICAALSVCGKRAVLLMQNTGFLDSINAIRAIGMQMDMPVCMIVGLLGKEPEKLPSESTRYSIRIMEPIIDAMGIDRINIEGPDDVVHLRPAIDKAYATARPMVALIGRKVQP